MNKRLIVDKLYEIIEEHGLIDVLYLLKDKNVKLKMGYSKKTSEASVDELNLSVRSSNALMRANLKTIGSVVDVINDGELIKIKNLGVKSQYEIRIKVFEYGYFNLYKHEKKDFILNFLENNEIKINN